MSDHASPVRSVRVVGRGRAGSSFADALGSVGWAVELLAGRDGPLTDAATGVDLVLLCVPDAAVTAVSASIRPGTAVVAHVAGSLGVAEIEGHERRAAIHPLASLADGARGSARLRAGTTFSIAGDPIVREVVVALGGHAIEVPDQLRVDYHAAATIASNHLVGLLGQVDRVAAGAGLPLEAYLPLVTQTLENVAALGPARALTGPAARGDTETLARHRAALDEPERPAYDAMADLCRRLAGRS